MELTNQFYSPTYQKTVRKMCKLYDRHLAHWRKNSVSYNDYQRFGVLFDRKLTWSEKEKKLNAFNNEN